MLQYFDKKFSSFSPRITLMSKKIEEFSRNQIILKQKPIQSIYGREKKIELQHRLAQEKKLRKLRYEKSEQQRMKKFELELAQKNAAELLHKHQLQERKNTMLNIQKEKLLANKQLRLIESNSSNRRLSSVKSQKPLYVKLEENFMANKLLQGQITAKKVLQERKESMISLSFEDLKSHEQKYLQKLKANEHSRIEKCKRSQLDSMINLHTTEFYQSKISHILQAEKLKAIHDEKFRESNKKILINKRLNYGNLVQDLYSSASSSPCKTFQHSSPKKQPKKMISYLQFLNQTSGITKISKHNKSSNNLSDFPSAKKQISICKSADYLTDMRKKRRESGITLSISKLPQLHLEKASSVSEKLKIVKKFTTALDNRTNKLESLFKASEPSLMQCEALSKAYIDAIHIKLSILENISKEP